MRSPITVAAVVALSVVLLQPVWVNRYRWFGEHRWHVAGVELWLEPHREGTKLSWSGRGRGFVRMFDGGEPRRDLELWHHDGRFSLFEPGAEEAILTIGLGGGRLANQPLARDEPRERVPRETGWF